MSNIKITDKIKAKSNTEYKVGQYYKDNTNGYIYILSEYKNDYYLLMDVKTGHSYSGSTVTNIIDAFSGDEDDFEIINNVEIIIS